MIRIAVALLLFLGLAGPVFAQGCRLPQNAPGIQAQVAQLMNAERQRRGLRPLTFSPALQRAAERHVCDMAVNGVESHRGSDGSTFARRLRAVARCGTGAENIAWGQRSPSSVITSWMGSSGHRANILNRSVTSYGIAVAQPSRQVGGGPRWVMVLGQNC